MDVCTRLGVLAPGEVYHPDQTKTKTIFVVGQLIYAILWLLPTPIFFHFRFLNTTFLLVLVVAGIWRGGSYYIFVFSKVYHPDQTKTKVIFVVGQLIYAILWLLPTPIFFHFRFLNTAFLLVLVVAGIWRGGSYYIFVFS